MRRVLRMGNSELDRSLIPILILNLDIVMLFSYRSYFPYGE